MRVYSSNYRSTFPPLLTRLKREARASLAVEMAILLPLIFALIFAVIDVSRLLLTRSWTSLHKTGPMICGGTCHTDFGPP